jgi:hypothetical protein
MGKQLTKLQQACFDKLVMNIEHDKDLRELFTTRAAGTTTVLKELEAYFKCVT